MSVTIKNKPDITDYVRRHWFLVGILTCILLAAIHPHLGSKDGPLRPEFTVKYVAVSLIFLISGLSLKTESLLYTLQQYRLHVFIQGFTFLFIPLLLQFLVKFLDILGVDGWILKGLITVACMPPPVSSAVILTRAANGNEAAAIFNSVLGSFLGILFTPASLLVNLGFTTLVPLLGTVVQLLCTVLTPLLVGQCIRRYSSWRWHGGSLNTVGQCSLLYVIYTTFCDTFAQHEIGLNAVDVLVTIFLVLLIQMLLLAVSFSAAQHFDRHFSPQDVAAIVFCATHKSLTLGIPILRIMFHGFSHLSQISLPLLVYHPTQIILGGLLVSGLKDWVRSQNSKKLPI